MSWLPPRGYRDFYTRLLRWLLGWGLVILVSLGVMLLFLLIQATNNRELYERNYVRLFVLNVVVATLLVSVIGWAMVQLLARLRQGKFGSRLLLKLAAIFAVVGFVPGVLIYLVSYQFVSRSIESWFDVKVEGALTAGLNLGRATFDALGSDLGNKTRAAATQLSGVTDAAAGLHLERLREQLDASDVLLWNPGGTLVASAGQSRFQINPERPSAQQLRNARSQRVVTQVLGLDEAANADTGAARVSALALVPSPNIGLLAEPRYLQVTQRLPQPLVANALAVQEAHREYQERALGREGLRRMYIGTLTLCLFLAVLGAVLLAVVLGNQLARPLLLIAEGVRQVAAGDLSPKQVLQGHDEVRSLTRAFADMTQQLADARGAIEQSLSQLHDARESLQTILDNLTAGVIVLQRDGQMLSFNPSAARILRKPLSAYMRQQLAQVPGLEGFAGSVQAQFAGFDEEQHGHDHWQHSYTLQASHEQTQRLNPDGITLVARGALLPDATRLLVFDDISEVVSAQRTQAWGEVARRLAHEIKNPLTPIQLSAERLAMKLEGKLFPPEQVILAKSVQTIVDQVDAMKRLVNEFRDYARLPAAVLKTLDLNALVQDVLQLYGGLQGEGGSIQVQLDPACPPVQGDAQQLRQVIHNLLQNAQDACDSAQRTAPGGECIVIRTQWHEATGRVRLSVLDRGAGFAEHILKRAFEPYVTTKAKGTGLGLAVVRKIAEEHGARVDIANRVTNGVTIGAQVSLSFPVNGEARVG